MKQKVVMFMALGLIIAGLAIYGYFRAISGLNNQIEKYPRIEVVPQSFDFGEIEYGDVAEYTFKVENSGEGILEIKKVATSCACTTAETEKETLKPGEKTNLFVKYNTGAMSGPHARGKQERIIYIKSNDPINPQIEAMIYAYVK